MLGRIFILTDAAHSFGAWYKGQRAGAYSDITVFSFHAVKNITTAEGGAVALNLPDRFDCDMIYDHLNTLSLHGQSKDALAKITTRRGWEYDVPEPGFKGNMTDIQASLGLIALKYYDSETLPARKRIMERYQEAFSLMAGIRVPVLKTNIAETAYHLYLLRIPGITRKKRDEIIEKIFDRGVAVNVHYKPLPMLTAFNEYALENYPVAHRSFSSEITLPVYEQLTENQLHEIIHTCREVISTLQKR
jgi:dTDP-4-amino-4,6-dideoxygalactose transaminase